MAVNTNVTRHSIQTAMLRNCELGFYNFWAADPISIICLNQIDRLDLRFPMDAK